MRVIKRLGREDIAVVYIAETDSGKRIEFVESVEPPIPREKKWVNIVSTLYGCPVKCPICDAGNSYSGKLSAEDILFQIDFLVSRRFDHQAVPVEKWKIQFARMGEPAFNRNVLEVLRKLPQKYNAPGLMPSISTIAPQSAGRYFDELLDIKRNLYPQRFQFQFSIHSTDFEIRQSLIPVRTWRLRQMAEYGERFFEPGSRKITLNFALVQDVPVDPSVIRDHFDPEVFIIKITPLNPTLSVLKSGIIPMNLSSDAAKRLFNELKECGFQVIVSVGELEENAIGSNCGQYVSSMNEECDANNEIYRYSAIET